ncbi:MAG: glycosyltransferase [Chloroflexota bacterium]|nr:MAG: glycosyltransferase [Chloroflexota bacterium]
MTTRRGAALAVMAQMPIPGRVKTRLQPHLTPQESADIYRAFLQDTLDLAASMKGYTPFLAFAPQDRESYFAEIAPAPFHLLAQSEGDLGHRMLTVFLRLERSGYSPMVVIGTDIPTLQPTHLQQALELLEASDVCLGPSTDGGYYLIGARNPPACLFEGMTWSTSAVFQTTIERAEAAQLSLSLLEPCTDVDRIEDLLWLRREFARLKHMTGVRIPIRTDACLAKLEPKIACL